MFADSAERVYVGVIGIMIEILVLFVDYLLGGSKFDWEGVHLSYIVFAAKATVYHLDSICRMSEVCSRSIELARSGISDGWRRFPRELAPP